MILYTLGSIASVVFPIFASYRAIKSHDMAYATPWLKFWVIMGIEQAVESSFGVVLSVLPLYSLARLGFFAWLVLPQSQGAVQLYDQKVEPFLDRYNSQIEDFFANGHTYVFDYALRFLSELSKWYSGEGFNMNAVKETTPRTVPPPPSVDTPQSYLNSVVGYLKSRSPASGGKMTMLFDMYRVVGSPRGGAFKEPADLDIPTTLPASEQLGLIDQERSRLLAALSSLDERVQLLQNEKNSRSNTSVISGASTNVSEYASSLAASEMDFDMVRQEEVAGHEGKSTAREDRAPTKGWFWQRRDYQVVGESSLQTSVGSVVPEEEEPLIPTNDRDN